jgi:prolyl-tRNA synthetase
MRLSKLFGKPSKTEGADYQLASHRLLTQAGFIRESTAGRYYLLPLGIKVHEKVTGIVRRHMNAAGAQEVVMPVLHPLELWKETNRTTTTGFELMKITDRREAEFALGGTAEEMAVDLVRKFNVSYKDLPFNIYQFSMKFRDELRARGGLLRVREFVMKDAYSFSTEDQFNDIYQQMWDTYAAIFKDCGMDIDVVAADNGYIGGEYCHEFILESDAGESRYFIDPASGYAAHEDVAVSKVEQKNVSESELPITEVEAVRGTTMEDGVKVHGLPMWQQIKDVLYVDEPTNRYILAIIRGDFDVNETKLTHVADAWGLRPATVEEIREDLGSEPGFISPVGIAKVGKKSKRPLVVVADPSLRTVKNAYGGNNKLNSDLKNINIGRDYTPDIEGDILMVQPGMPGKEGGALQERKGIEVGNIFQLGYHYSNLMKGAEYTNEAGKRQKYYMGCYGIGIGRTMAAIVERYHDDRGILWPESVAPFKAVVIRLGAAEAVLQEADSLYDRLLQAGIDVLYDDRNASAGEKFTDADLIGIPYRVVVSEKTLQQGGYEVKKRSESAVSILDFTSLIKCLDTPISTDILNAGSQRSDFQQTTGRE